MQFLQQRKDRTRPNYPTRKSTSDLKAARERADLLAEYSAAEAFSPWEGIETTDSADSASEVDLMETANTSTRDGRLGGRIEDEFEERGRSSSRRGREGDDELSSFDEEGEDAGRGRGRTRERRKVREEEDPVLNKSMLEDALRSSLATLLSLSSSPQNAFSQTPALSHTSLTALLSPTPARPSTPLRTIDNLNPASRDVRTRISPFAHALSESIQAEEEEDLQWEKTEEGGEGGRDNSESEDPVMEFSEEGDSDASDDDRRRGAPEGFARSMPIPALSTATHPHTNRGRNQSKSLPTESTFASPASSRLTTMSSVLPSSTNGSPSVSRRRTQRRRGQRRASLSPGPASVEERRRARGNVVVTDTEDQSIEPDRVFAELVEAAKGFMIMSPRLNSNSNPLGVRDGLGMESTTLLPTLANWVTPLSPLASSAPTIDLSSSGADLDDSPHARPAIKSKKSALVGVGVGVGGGGKEGESWFDWLRKSFSIRVWHLTAVASVCIGIGFTAGVIWKGKVVSTRFNTFSSF